MFCFLDRYYHQNLHSSEAPWKCDETLNESDVVLKAKCILYIYHTSETILTSLKRARKNRGGSIYKFRNTRKLQKAENWRQELKWKVKTFLQTHTHPQHRLPVWAWPGGWLVRVPVTDNNKSTSRKWKLFLSVCSSVSLWPEGGGGWWFDVWCKIIIAHTRTDRLVLAWLMCMFCVCMNILLRGSLFVWCVPMHSAQEANMPSEDDQHMWARELFQPPPPPFPTTTNESQSGRQTYELFAFVVCYRCWLYI